MRFMQGTVHARICTCREAPRKNAIYAIACASRHKTNGMHARTRHVFRAHTYLLNNTMCDGSTHRAHKMGDFGVADEMEPFVFSEKLKEAD